MIVLDVVAVVATAVLVGKAVGVGARLGPGWLVGGLVGLAVGFGRIFVARAIVGEPWTARPAVQLPVTSLPSHWSDYLLQWLVAFRGWHLPLLVVAAVVVSALAAAEPRADNQAE